MSARSLLRALVVTAATFGPLAIATAVHSSLCLNEAGCVTLAVDANDDGSVEAQVDTSGTCVAYSTGTACLDAQSVGTSVSNPPPPPPPPSGPHVYNGGCTHVPVPGDARRVEVTARITVVPHPGSTASGETRCRVYVGGVLKGTVTATGASGIATQHFLVTHYSLRVCTAVTARWEDGHTEGYQSATRACIPEHS